MTQYRLYIEVAEERAEEREVVLVYYFLEVAQLHRGHVLGSALASQLTPS